MGLGALMAFPQLALPNTSGPLGQVCKELSRVLSVILDKAHLDSQVLVGITIKSGSVQNVAHKLGRRLVGWKIVRQRGSAILWDSQDDKTVASAPELYLYLHASADVVVDLEVF